MHDLAHLNLCAQNAGVGLARINYIYPRQHIQYACSIHLVFYGVYYRQFFIFFAQTQCHCIKLSAHFLMDRFICLGCDFNEFKCTLPQASYRVCVCVCEYINIVLLLTALNTAHFSPPPLHPTTSVAAHTFYSSLPCLTTVIYIRLKLYTKCFREFRTRVSSIRRTEMARETLIYCVARQRHRRIRGARRWQNIQSFDCYLFEGIYATQPRINDTQTVSSSSSSSAQIFTIYLYIWLWYIIFKTVFFALRQSATAHSKTIYAFAHILCEIRGLSPSQLPSTYTKHTTHSMLRRGFRCAALQRW